MRIEEGKFYRDADGEKRGPMRRDADGDPYDLIPWDYFGSSGYFTEYGKSDGSDADLVAEWVEDGPVREVTRREIVPGVYGRIIVRSSNTSAARFVEVGFDGGNRFTSDEIEAAANTLLELAGALRDA